MNPHLCAEEISQWIVGERSDRCAGHLAECAVCAREVERMESALAEFRGAVCRHPVPPLVDRRHRAPLAVRWALAAAALIAVAMVPVWRHRQAEMQAEAARADAILLDQVDAEVSEAVPSPMQPLVPLVSWSATPEGNGETQ